MRMLLIRIWGANFIISRGESKYVYIPIAYTV
jgi:hypothetical protein